MELPLSAAACQNERDTLLPLGAQRDRTERVLFTKKFPAPPPTEKRIFCQTHLLQQKAPGRERKRKSETIILEFYNMTYVNPHIINHLTC